MDYVGPIIGIAEMIFAPMWKCCNYCRGAIKYRITLKEKWQRLELRELDTIAIMNTQLLPGTTPKQEVKGWLQDVEKMKKEIEAIERKAGEGKCFSRAHIGKIAFNKIQEVNELYERGNFSDSLVVDPPIPNGEVFPIPPTLGGESTTKRVKKEIWACMMDDNVRKISVYGMGGIGKSTIMKQINNLLLKETGKFDSVIWVTVSKAFSVGQLQNDIAKKLNLKFEIDDVTTRAAKLMEALEKRKRHVLILDDMWEAFALEEVGIPEPTLENGCKLVLTTRLLDVCKGMCCEEIKMELFSKDEARKLFLNHMGCDFFNNPNLETLAEEVIEKCSQLPLAIVTIAASFKLLSNEFEWKDALEELKTSVIRTNDSEERVFETLKFSYDRLKGEKLKRCLLHCALYPEDFKIEKQELIEHLIDEGIIEEMKSRQLEFNNGYSILIKLENACLLECEIDAYYGQKKNFVKMHDLVREMVLEVASPQFMVEGRLGLEDFSNEGKWREGLVKASLMHNNISTIPSNVSPRCPKLSTLLLQGNHSLENVSDSLFEHLHGLKVLDLSYTGIESLPNSVFSLENLTTLRLEGCEELKHVSSLAKLTTLRKLDLGGTGITEVPDGLEMLVNLTYLNLNAEDLKIMPLGILPKLSRLQYLRFSCKVTVKGEEIERLKKLENVWVRFDDLYEFCSFIRSFEKRQLACYQIQVRKSVEDLDQEIEDVEKSVILEKCNLRGDESLVLPEDLQFLKLKTCEHLRSLCDVPSLKQATKLKKIRIEDCEGLEHVVSSTSPSYSDSLQTLEILELLKLKNLRGLFRQERAASGWVPLDTFSFLKVIFIHKCPIKKLLPLGLLLHLHKLEEIRVENCLELEEIIAEACDEFEEDEKEKEEKGMDTTEITLPKLKELSLTFLPELKTICSSSKVIVCDSLEKIEIGNCPKVKRLPLSPSPPPSLQSILGNHEWWESVEWDCPDTKNVFQPFFQSVYPVPVMYSPYMPYYVRSVEEDPNACTIC